jgi:hypothetical protein
MINSFLLFRAIFLTFYVFLKPKNNKIHSSCSIGDLVVFPIITPKESDLKEKNLLVCHRTSEDAFLVRKDFYKEFFLGNKAFLQRN